MKISKLFGILAALGASAGANLPGADNTAPVSVIFDTDMSADCDDAGALAILNKLCDTGEAQILACVSDGRDQDKAIAASIDAINTYYGRPHVPIGTYQGSKYSPSKSHYTAHLRDEFPHTAPPDDQEPKALDIYRKTLAAAPDGSVTLICVGFVINLEQLLQSPADETSPLDGMDLVRKKIKQLVVMGGAFPQCAPHHGEYNFMAHNGGPDTQYVVENWPTPILFSGFEIGYSIITGSNLGAAPTSDPVRRAYELSTSLRGRSSWDLTAVLAAVRDPTLYWTVEADGYCQVNADGSNEWFPTPNRGHSYLVAKTPLSDLVELINDLLIQAPQPTN
jgi:hypothetical protein